jgi:hypothetical protein
MACFDWLDLYQHYIFHRRFHYYPYQEDAQIDLIECLHCFTLESKHPSWKAGSSS